MRKKKHTTRDESREMATDIMATSTTKLTLFHSIRLAPSSNSAQSKGSVDLDVCLPLNKASILHEASEASVRGGTAVTVLTYLHGVKEAQLSIDR